MTYVLIRFSVLLRNTKAWTISKKDVDSYRSSLFDTTRLEEHFELFEKITLPSLVFQDKKPSSDWMKTYLITSESLPEWAKCRLKFLVECHDWIEIIFLPESGVVLEQCVIDDVSGYGDDTFFSTVRLDDDDALSKDFFIELDKYFLERNIGYGLSFGKGYAGFYDFNSSKYEKFIDYYYPKFSAGLTYFNYYCSSRKMFINNEIKTIFNAGGHSKVDLKIPLILDSINNMFIRTMHKNSDSYSDKRDTDLKRKPAVEEDIVANDFILSNMYI